MSLDDVRAAVVAWQRETFAVRDPIALSRHLCREAAELLAELEEETLLNWACRPVPDELADCAILLFGIADSIGLDLAICIDRKLAINRERKWKEPDAEGVIEHE